MASSNKRRGFLAGKMSRRKLLGAGAIAAMSVAGAGLSGCSEEDAKQPAESATGAAPDATSGATIAAPTPDPQTAALMMGAGLGGNAEGITEVAPGTIFFPYFGNVIALLTDDGIVIIDTSLQGNGPPIVEELRKRTDSAVTTIVYTHGHIDHVGGTDAFLKDAADRGYERPAHLGTQERHPSLPALRAHGRLDTFHQLHPVRSACRPQRSATPKPVFVYPTDTYDERFDRHASAASRSSWYHGIGETDDHTWVWAPERSVVCAGDFFIWACPNVGNPWKVQRYAEGWADGLEAIAALHPATFLPGHGPVIQGDAAVQAACLDTARYLRSIAEQVVDRMNKGQWLEQILREVEPPADLVGKPYLQPVYGHPKFIVHGVWRQYGGWYDGIPADFFPASTADRAAEIVGLAGAPALLARARDLQTVGDLPLACHLVDWVCTVQPDNAEARRLQRDLFEARSIPEPNMMARNTFKGAATEAEKHLT